MTSLSPKDLRELYHLDRDQIPSAFEQLFHLALDTKMHGVVCSAHELELVKNCERQRGHSLIKVCPGIRFQEEIDQQKIGDQKRVLSPEQAVQKKVDFLVIGRSLTQTDHLKERLQQLKSIVLI